ncbi:ATP-binding protein [Dactylosporangium sp. NPDC006015]|uniref:sensor histidine kinase n=1 Tax=Dactylosporangium sp. NPDC006015 TaxID=3154576 RepID=UPI0033BC670C
MWRSIGFDGSAGAARAAAGLFLLAGVLAVLGVAQPHSRGGDLLVVAVADFCIAAAAWWAPWRRLHPRATVALALAGLVVLAFSTWAFGGTAAGTGPFFVLLFAWVGLHHPPWIAYALSPLTAAAYIAPLIATHQPPEVVGSAVVFVPVVTAVAVLIAGRVRQWRRAQDEVAAAERWRASLMLTLAHDVRSPLTAVQGALELLDEDAGLPPEHRARLTAAALRQVARIARLASGLLDVGRVEDGRLKLDLRPVLVRAAVADAVLLTPQADAVVDVEPGLTVVADPDRLEQMLVNLIGNAMRHGAAPICVSASASGGTTTIAVRDHGPGVPPDAVSALFSRYGGGAAPHSVGLGLWIVRELARAHDGDLTYEPAHPGACFVISLPARP